MRKKMKLGEVEEYIRTFSAVHGWNEDHPGGKRVAEGGDGDTVDKCFAEMREAEGGWGGEDVWRDFEVDVEWGHGLVLAKRTEKE